MSKLYGFLTVIGAAAIAAFGGIYHHKEAISQPIPVINTTISSSTPPQVSASTISSNARGGNSKGNQSKGGSIRSSKPVVPTSPPTSAPVLPPPVVIKPPVSTPTTTPPVISANMQWGTYADWDQTTVSNFETLAGAQMNIVATFVGWGPGAGDFPDYYSSMIKPAGKTMLIYWEPQSADYTSVNSPQYNYDSITSGQWDSYLKTFAAAAKAYGGNVILVPFDEMNDNVSPWDGTVNNNSAAKEIAAYRYVHSFFANVPNVKFGWDVNSLSVPNVAGNQIADYYPGADVVDYVGVSVFNFNNPGQSFASLAGPALTQLNTYNKPVYIFAVADAEGSQKASWITNGLGALSTIDPHVVGWVWFNEDKEEDWTINSDPAALAAFKSILQ